MPLILADWSIDNFKEHKEDASDYGRVEVWDSGFLFFDKENKLADIELVLNTENCGEAYSTMCRAIYKVTNYEPGRIIEDLRLEKIKGAEGFTTKEGDITVTIRDELYPNNRAEKLSDTYEYTSKEPSTYYIELKGYIERGSIYDHQIQVFGQWLTEFAFWNGINSEGLLAWYTFDNTYNDSLGKTNFTLSGTVPFGEGKFGNASLWTGNLDNYLTNLSTSIIPSQVNGTIEVWVKVNETLTNKSIWSASTGSQNALLFRILGTDLHLGIPISGGSYEIISFNDPVNINTSGYVHIAGTWNNTNMSLYINGVSVNSTSKSISTYPGALDGSCIGKQCTSAFNPGDNPFNGSIDELMLWDHERSAEEIIEDMAQGFIIVSLLYPDDDSFNRSQTVTFSGKSVGALSASSRNTTLYLWHPNGTIFRTNFTTISGEINITNLTLSSIPPNFNYSWNFLSCVDSVGGTTYCGYSIENRTLDTINENSQIFNTTTYDTMTENFVINISYGNYITSVTADLVYNGTAYAGTASGGGGEIKFTRSLNIDLFNTFENRTFYWDLTFDSIFSANSTTKYQEVNEIIFDQCNATLSDVFLNFTFLDEETLTRIGGQIDTSTFTYWLGNGVLTNELVYSNLTNSSEFDFCFTPAGETMHNTREVQYSSSGYPQRKFDDNTDLTSTITHKILYLLSSADGIYSTIQVVDENGDVVKIAAVTAERQFSGVWTVIGKEVTDGAGAVTFWVNPDYNHRFTIEKGGCVTNTETIRPTQTTYTATIDCLGISDEIYVAPIEGIKYFLLPRSGLITIGQQNFSFQVASSKSNLVNAKFEIVNGSGFILTSQTSACAAAGCTISKLYTVTDFSNIKGRYYIDLGDGYILLDADAHWINVNITKRDGTFQQFWLNLRTAFDDWHEEGEDITNTSDFSRIVFIFLFLAIGIAVFNKFTKFDSSNPGAFLIFLTAVVFMGSIAGFPDAKGFFYLDNFGVSYFVNNYLILGYMLIITVTHYIGVSLFTQKNR